MSKIILLLLFCSFTIIGQSQTDFRVSTTYATEQGTIDREIAPSIVLRNLTNQTLTLRWEVQKRNLSEGWQAVICDRQCYGTTTDVHTFKLQPREVLHDFQVSFRPNGKEGMGHVELLLTVEGRPDQKQSITFSGAAKQSTNRLTNLNRETSAPSVYPNPVTEFMNIQDDYNRVKHIEVYNVVGRKMLRFSVTYTGEKYDVSRLPRGIYMVRMLDEQGSILRTQRISKYNP